MTQNEMQLKTEIDIILTKYSAKLLKNVINLEVVQYYEPPESLQNFYTNKIMEVINQYTEV